MPRDKSEDYLNINYFSGNDNPRKRVVTMKMYLFLFQIVLDLKNKCFTLITFQKLVSKK